MPDKRDRGGGPASCMQSVPVKDENTEVKIVHWKSNSGSFRGRGTAANAPALLAL